jgi:hypothetical protein
MDERSKQFEEMAGCSDFWWQIRVKDGKGEWGDDKGCVFEELWGIGKLWLPACAACPIVWFLDIEIPTKDIHSGWVEIVRTAMRCDESKGLNPKKVYVLWIDDVLVLEVT